MLAAHMARSFHVALIDEFQDTDPVQYAIFRDGFVHQGRPVFLVGDGAAMTAAFLEKADVPFRMAPENLVWQDAWGVAMAAMDKPRVSGAGNGAKTNSSV